MQDILKISGDKNKTSEDERVDVTDLMSRLMKGDTLSDEDMLLLREIRKNTAYRSNHEELSLLRSELSNLEQEFSFLS